MPALKPKPPVPTDLTRWEVTLRSADVEVAIEVYAYDEWIARQHALRKISGGLPVAMWCHMVKRLP